MPRHRAGFIYSTKADATKFPIVEGYIVKCDEQHTFFNEKAKVTLDHELYIWILRISQRLNRRVQPKFRKVRVLLFYKPLLKDMKYNYKMSGPKYVTKYHITKLMRKGHQVIDENCIYHYNKQCVKKFYRIIQML